MLDPWSAKELKVELMMLEQEEEEQLLQRQVHALPVCASFEVSHSFQISLVTGISISKNELRLWYVVDRRPEEEQ
jgi:HKD family nuclease